MLLHLPTSLIVAKKVHDFLTVGAAAAPLHGGGSGTGLHFPDSYYQELQAEVYGDMRDLFLKGT